MSRAGVGALALTLTLGAPHTASAQADYSGEAIVAFDCALDRLIVHDVASGTTAAALPLYVREGKGVDHETIGGARDFTLRGNRLAFTSPTSFSRQLFPLSVWQLDLARGGPEIVTGFAAERTRGTVTGVVTDPAGRPIQGATVRAQRSLDSAVSDAQGRFSLAAPLGDVTVFAYGWDGANVDAWGRGDGAVLQSVGDTVTQDVELTTTFTGRYGFGQPAWAPGGSLYMSLYGPIGDPAIIPTGRWIYEYDPGAGSLAKIAPSGQTNLGLCGFAPSPDGTRVAIKPLFGGLELASPTTFLPSRQLLDSVEHGPTCSRFAWRSNTQLGAIARPGGALKRPVFLGTQGTLDAEIAYPPDPRLGWGTDVWAFSPDGSTMLLTDGGRRFRLVAVDHAGTPGTRPYAELTFDCDPGTPGTQACPNVCAAAWGQVSGIDRSAPGSIDRARTTYSVGPDFVRTDFPVPVDAAGARPDTYQICMSTTPPTSVRQHCRDAGLTVSVPVDEPAGGPDWLEIGGLAPQTEYHITVWPHDAYLGSDEVLYIRATTLAATAPPQDPGMGGQAGSMLDPDSMTDPEDDPFEPEDPVLEPDAGGEMDAGGTGGTDAGGGGGEEDAGGSGSDAGGGGGGVDAGASPEPDAGSTGGGEDAGTGGANGDMDAGGDSGAPARGGSGETDEGCQVARGPGAPGSGAWLLILLALLGAGRRGRVRGRGEVA
jgi:MYXO-CTERM domain-containing protein